MVDDTPLQGPLGPTPSSALPPKATAGLEDYDEADVTHAYHAIDKAAQPKEKAKGTGKKGKKQEQEQGLQADVEFFP